METNMKDEARKKAILHLKDMMREMMSEPIKGAKPQKEAMAVKVAGDSPEAVEAGLDKAKEMMKKRAEMMGYDSEESEDEEIESPEETDVDPSLEAQEEASEPSKPLEEMSKEELLEYIKNMK